jgi:dTDP-4-dehydrorhamnose reductase
LITGSSGRLGKYLTTEFPLSLAPTHEELDITNHEAVLDYFNERRPDQVIHAAAWVDVRGCENDHRKAWKANVVGTENVVDAVARFNPDCYFVYMSTACVFDGDRGDYTEDDTPYPKNMYGLTKLVAEETVKKLGRYLIIRTDFVERAKWRYPGAYIDRFSTSVFSDTVATGIGKVVREGIRGTIHLTGRRKISHFDLARLTTPDVKPIKLADTDLPLPRDQSLKSVKGWDNLDL